MLLKWKEGQWQETEVSLPDSLTTLGYGAFEWGDGTKLIRLSPGIKKLKEPLSGCYAICYTQQLASQLENPIYLGGSPQNLSGKARAAAARCYVYAIGHGIREIERWREDYLAYYRQNPDDFVIQAYKDQDMLLFLAREAILEEDHVNHFLKNYQNKDDVEVKDALLQLKQQLREQK